MYNICKGVRRHKTVIELVLTACLVLSAVYQGSWNRASNSNAQKQVRAYLSVTGGHLTYNAKTRKAEASVTLQNTGNSFAHKVTLMAGMTCKMLDDPEAKRPQVTETPQARPMSIGPSGRFVFPLSWQIKNWDPEDIPKMRCWLQGRVEYVDEFGEKHHTNFRFVQGGPSDAKNHFKIEYDDFGNDAT